MQRMSLKERVLSTMKSRDTESNFELYVTRTPGYLWALFFRQLHVHPIVVTLLSTVLGAAAGFFFWSENLRQNLIGMLLLVWANWYDCADGQLARMTGQKTLLGRILDGFAGDVWFFSIYLFITLRLTPQWGIWIWLLCAWAGFRCHARQCAIADYYRNVHLWFLPGVDNELNTSEAEQREYNRLRWASSQWFHKLYLFFYISYTQGQEAQ
ncbi:MAG: CDP-alcohol phosphatidyltransferase family protein, partial [Bacteroidaceae bacterium]|nr:CDP-alcohol phosphatidyltransferase family protein [Bacteroidaceae bacterium]